MEFSHRILVVDDDRTVLELVEEIFSQELPSFEVVTATDVDAAFEVLDESTVECIVSDYRMPSTDGLTFLELVREESPDLPFVVFTARGSEEIAGDAVFGGATDYIRKKAGTSQIRLLAKRVSTAIETYRTERELTRLQRRYELVSRTASDGFWEWSVERDVVELSEGFRRLFGFDTSTVDDAFEWWVSHVHPEDRDRVVTTLVEALDLSSEAVGDDPSATELPTYEDEYRFRTATGEYAVVHVRASVLDDGDDVHVVGTATDVTERRQRDAALHAEHRRFRAIFEKSFDAMVIADDEGRYVDANASACELFGLPTDELVGKSIADFAPEGFDFDAAWEAFQTDSADRGIFPLVRPDGERRFVEYAATSDVLPGRHFSILRDVTERVRTRNALLQHQAVVERMSDLAYILDREFRFVYVNRAFCETVGRDRESILGSHLSEFAACDAEDGFLGRQLSDFVDALDGRVDETTANVSITDADGTDRVVENRLVPYVSDGDVLGIVGVGRDVTARVEAEADRRATNELLEGIVSASPVPIMTLDPEGKIDLWNDAAEETFGWSRSEVVGERPPMVPPAAEERFEERLERLRDGESLTGLEVERTRRDGTRMYLRISTAPLTDADGEFAGTVALVSDVTDMREREEKLAAQHDELDRLNRLNSLVRDINRDLVQASTREEIERVVCDHFASHPPCRFAWLGEHDRRTDELVSRHTAGAGDGFLDDVSPSVADPAAADPASLAVRTGAVQFVDDVEALSTDAAWRSAALERGCRSVAAIPLVYDKLEYGVLVVCGDDPEAFTDEDEAVFAELGGTIAYAINAEERVRSLVTDGVVELTFRLRDSSAFFSRLSASMNTPLTLERVALRSDGACRFIVSVATDDPDALSNAADAFDAVESVTLLNEREDRAIYELTTSDAFVARTFANHGGILRSLTADDGDVEFRVELPASTDVRSVVTAVQESHPDAELRAQRQRADTEADVGTAGLALSELMTDRQREALETAYFAGYFDTPRDNSGIDIAEMLDISQPTFHQHLRAGQKRLFTDLFE